MPITALEIWHISVKAVLLVYLNMINRLHIRGLSFVSFSYVYPEELNSKINQYFKIKKKF